MTAIKAQDITGVILAGGRGHRMGGVDKGLVPLRGRPLIEYVIDALRPQVGRLVISANRNQEIYAAYGFPVIADIIGDYDGPLAGMLSAMRAADTPYILTAPCDAPALPADLTVRLAAVLTDAHAEVCVASRGGRMQPVFALLRCTLADDLQKYLERGGREAGEWMRQRHAAVANFSDKGDVFVNINTAEELQRLNEEQAGAEGKET